MTKGCGEDVAPFVLGALPPEDAERFRAHLEGCELCQADVARLQPVVDTLPMTPDLMTPPPELRERIMAEVRASMAPAQEARAAAATSERRWWLRPLPALAAACVLLVAGVMTGVVLDDGGGGDPSRTVTGQVAAAGAEATVVLRGGDGRLRVSGLPRAPRDRVWQVWLMPDGATEPRPTDALFDVNARGDASVDVPGDLRRVARVLVTHEPVGGSTKPTVKPVINVRI